MWNTIATAAFFVCLQIQAQPVPGIVTPDCGEGTSLSIGGNVDSRWIG